MKRNHITFVLATCLFAICVPGQGNSFGQVSKHDHDKRLIEKLVVNHASMMHAQEVLEAALADDNSHLIADDNGDSFVVIGSELSIRLAKDALAKIDQKPEAKPLKKTAVFRMANIEASAALMTIERMLGGSPEFRAAVDSRTNSLVISADEKQTTEVRALIELLDKAATTEKPMNKEVKSNDCQMRLSWLVESDSFPESDQKMLRKVRPSLQKLAERLMSESGASSIETLTDVQTLAGKGEFRNTSLREMNIGNIEITVVGVATASGKDKFELDLKLSFGTGGQQINLESHFTAPSNHPVAFSVSDIGGIRSYLIVEVDSP